LSAKSIGKIPELSMKPSSDAASRPWLEKRFAKISKKEKLGRVYRENFLDEKGNNSMRDRLINPYNPLS
jgi:hypothetical protein